MNTLEIEDDYKQLHAFSVSDISGVSTVEAFNTKCAMTIHLIGGQTFKLVIKDLEKGKDHVRRYIDLKNKMQSSE